jgi:dsDNA-specific endonuclease/ATPase MutS2
MAGFMDKIKGWLNNLTEPDYEVGEIPLDEQGFVRDDLVKGGSSQRDSAPAPHVVVAEPKGEKSQSLDRIQENFTRFVDQLQGINTNLSRQVAQQEQLGEKLDKLPSVIQGLPEMLENQHRSLDEVLRQLRSSQIPREAVKQTETIQKMNQHLAAAAETDMVMRDAFTSFSETVAKLTEATEANRDAILNMSKAFSASDRYMKYLVQVQNRRFVWVFLTSVVICLLAILAMLAAIGILR